MIYEFPLTPIPAPRMTRSDKWNKRDCVVRYFSFREAFILLCNKNKFRLKGELSIIFHLPMPEGWSNKKKIEMNGKPHQQRPDCDNMIKSICDAFGVDDGFVWSITAKKYWSVAGKIIIIE